MRCSRIAHIVLTILVLVATAGRSDSQERPRGQIATVPAQRELGWPLSSATKAYDAIDGNRMKRHVEELATISRKDRDSGNRQWGRIAGTPSGEET